MVYMNREEFDNLFRIYRPVQHPDELYWLIKKVEKIHPKTILEIGVQAGGTFAFWNKILSNNTSLDCMLIGIDLKNTMRWDTKKSKNNIKFLIVDSRKKETINIVKYLLKNRPIDFAFIDGNHTEDAVTSDYQNYSKLVQKRGIVAFHDIYNKSYPGVRQFWNKVKGKKDAYSSGVGIGIIEM